MVQAETLKDLRYREPFQPFRIHLKTGKAVEVRFPRLAVVGRTFINVGVPIPDDPDPELPLASHVEYIRLTNIESVELIVSESGTPMS